MSPWLIFILGVVAGCFGTVLAWSIATMGRD